MKRRFTVERKKETQDKNLFSSNSDYFNFIAKMKKKPWKYIYTGIIPKTLRKKIEKEADFSQQEHIGECWKREINKYFNRNTEKFILKPKKDLSGKKIIWQYWGQGWEYDKFPDIVKLCFQSVEKYKGDYTVIRLDNDTIFNYIDFPEFIKEKTDKGKIKYVFLSDLLRLALLDVYGGVWLDATILLTDYFPERFEKADYFVFQRSEEVQDRKKWEKFNNDYFSWDKRQKVKMLSSIIFAKKGNKVIHILLELMLIYWEKYEEVYHYFFLQILYDTIVSSYLPECKCEIVDDTLPHLLIEKFENRFSQKELDEILNEIKLHKLTYNKVYKPDSFYSFFREKFKI